MPFFIHACSVCGYNVARSNIVGIEARNHFNIGLSFLSHEVPQALIALGSVAVGALGSLFTHSK